MNPSREVLDAIAAAEAEGRVTEGGRAPVPPPEELLPRTERAFQAKVVAFAKRHGWKCYHTYRSDRSEPGFPDLVMIRPASNGQAARIVVAELKAGKNECTPAQREWVALFLAANVPTYVWRNTAEHWEQIRRVLA